MLDKLTTTDFHKHIFQSELSYLSKEEIQLLERINLVRERKSFILQALVDLRSASAKNNISENRMDFIDAKVKQMRVEHTVSRLFPGLTTKPNNS